MMPGMELVQAPGQPEEQMTLAGDGESGGAPTAGLRRGRPRGWWLGIDPVGLATATFFAALAMTPSLLPRTWLFQGVVSGITAAVGYGLGVLLAWALRRTAWWRRLSGHVQRRAPLWLAPAARTALLLLMLVTLAVMLAAAATWQREIAALVGMEQPTLSGWARSGPLLVVVAAALVALARGVRWLSRRTARLLRRWVRLPRWFAAIAGAGLAGLLVVTVLNDVLLQQALRLADAAFEVSNQATFDGVEQPTDATRSGSPASLVGWDTLGREGRRFVAGGLSSDEWAQGGTAPVADPVRAYVGLNSAPDARARADLALAELERAGAFDRAVLVVVTTTGSGWVNEAAVQSVELMYRGDTAVVATQYSYLPSWLSFLVDRSRAQEAGQLLVDGVTARVEQLPPDDRPKVLIYGESLGSQGSESAFTSLADIRARTDGVLWVGPPNSNEIWSAIVARRDPGTPAVQPVYASGLVVRFAGDRSDLNEPPTPWEHPRVLYLQHASDPIVWWSPDLLFSRPDWLVEPRGSDVSPAMSWYPVVTFWQVTADLVNSQSVPDGHGHNYNDLILDGWVAVAAPEGWTDADTERVRNVLRT